MHFHSEIPLSILKFHSKLPFWNTQFIVTQWTKYSKRTLFRTCNWQVYLNHSVYAFDRVLLELKMESTESAAARRDNKLSYDVFSITFESISLVHKMLEGISRSYNYREHLNMSSKSSKIVCIIRYLWHLYLRQHLMHSRRHDVVDAAAGATDIGRSEVEDKSILKSGFIIFSWQWREDFQGPDS